MDCPRKAKHLTGGYADKLGNRYEGRWTVRQMLRVLSEELRSVVLDSVGDSQRGIDLRIRQRNGTEVVQQCKIRNKSHDKWTIADLARAGVLAAMKSFLSENSKGEFSFISAVPSTGLHDLCESARASNGNAEDFYEHQVQELGSPRRKLFSEFCNRLGLSNTGSVNVEAAFDYLRRMFIESYSDDRRSHEDLLRDAANLVVGPPETTVAVLADFAQAQLRQTLDAPLIWKHLESQDLQPRRLDSDPRILPAIRDLQRRFADSIRNDLIAGELIHRAETDRLLVMLGEHPVVVVHGAPGQGKSGVLFELIKRFESDRAVYLPIRLDRNEPKHTTRKFGADLGLPESPVHCLKSIAGGRPAIVILDQLDAIRWTSRHSLNALEVCKSLVGEVKSLSALGIPISVVIACRTYDLKNDPQIRAWLGSKVAEEEPAVEIQVSPLSIDVVAEVAKRVGGSDLRLSQRQSGILQSPQHLAMWARIVGARGSFEFQNRTQLMREFWADRMRELDKWAVSAAAANAVLNLIISYMERHGKIAAPTGVVDEGPVLDALCGCGLIVTDGHQLTFTHQSYLDYQIAKRVVGEIYGAGSDILEWIGSVDKQTLFRREQLRQALCLMGEDSADHFLSSIRSILFSDNIRFHLKHLCLEVLGQLDKPSDALISFLLELANDPTWKEHVFGAVFFGHRQYVDHLVESGTIADWLEDDALRDHALWLLRGVAEAMPDQVASLLSPYCGRTDEWNLRILGTIPWHAEGDSDELFRLRMDLARKGVCRDFVDWGKLQVHRRLTLLASVLSSWRPADLVDEYGRVSSRQSRLESWTKEDVVALRAAVSATPLTAWALLTP